MMSYHAMLIAIPEAICAIQNSDWRMLRYNCVAFDVNDVDSGSGKS
jgi:hypothetical protein